MTIEEFRSALEARGLLDDVEQIAAEHCATLDEIAGREHTAHVARARHAAMRKVRERGLSTPAIGRLFGRNHSTVLYALRRTA